MSTYNPSQPRAPIGSSIGGQWISKAGAAARKAAGLDPEGWKSGAGDLETAKKFCRARDRLDGEKRGYLSDYTPEELANSGKRIFIHKDGQNGFLIDQDGDLQNLFSTNHEGRRSISLAIQSGAKKLDCFDGFLPKLYSQFGFVEYKREANWTPGGPDVVYMRLER